MGTYHWDLKSRPIFIPILSKNGTHFYTRATNFKQNLLKILHLQHHSAFKQISEVLASDWWNLSYFCTNFRKFWKSDQSLCPVLQQKRGHLYTRWLILRPNSAARPWRPCTKNPHPTPPQNSYIPLVAYVRLGTYEQ